MSSKKVLNYALRQDLTLTEAAEMANNLISHGNDTAMFLTLWAGRLNLLTGELEYVNCGHPSPFLRTEDGSVKKLSDVSGGAVGFFPGMKIPAFREKLCPGDSLLLYTDGIPDAQNAKGERFKTEGMEAFLKGLRDSGPVSDRLSEVLKAYEEGAELFDDQTLMEVRNTAKKA